MKTQKLEKVRLKKRLAPSGGPLVSQKVLADMKKQAWQQMQRWPHRELAFASIQFVSDHFGLNMNDKAVYRAALGLMANGYDDAMIRRARERLLVDTDFARRRHHAGHVHLEAADFETALQNDRAGAVMRKSNA